MLQYRRTTVAVLMALLSPLAIADLIQDSKTTVEIRNLYMNRDFRQTSAPQAKAEDWGVGALLNFQSGYTPGFLGAGFDVAALTGIKLDSGRGTRGTGTLPYSPDSGRSPDQFSAVMPTIKLRVNKSELRYGNLWPTLPVLFRNDTRLLPQSFYGTMIEDRSFDGLHLTAADIHSTRLRDSTGRDDLTVFGVAPTVNSDDMKIIGAEYEASPELQGKFFRSEVKDIYKQNFYNAILQKKFERFSVKLDLRYFDSNDSGSSRGGNIDNRNLNGLFTVTHLGHAVTFGYQKMIGSSAFPIINGTDPYTANLMTSQPFIRPNEKSLQLRYDLNMVMFGLPGLSFMSRYAKGTNIDRGPLPNDKEWERDLDIKYVIQSGALKNVYGMWRNTSYRSRYANDIDENRIILGYTFEF